MPKGKKRLTQREKAERAAIKKQLQADGVLPPDKPRLNRKKFAREVWDEFSEMDVYTADFYTGMTTTAKCHIYISTIRTNIHSVHTFFQ